MCLSYHLETIKSMLISRENKRRAGYKYRETLKSLVSNIIYHKCNYNIIDTHSYTYVYCIRLVLFKKFRPPLSLPPSHHFMRPFTSMYTCTFCNFTTLCEYLFSKASVLELCPITSIVTSCFQYEYD